MNNRQNHSDIKGEDEARPCEPPGIKRVGLLGGAFDPPHDGHLKLARLAWEHLNLNELRFVPSCVNPQKQASVAASPQARLAMLREMLIDTPFTIDDVELALGGVSYTVDTLEALHEREPDAAWILIMGSDQANNFTNWQNPERILEMASVSIATRPEPISLSASRAADIPRKPGGPTLPDILSMCITNEWSGAPGQAVILPCTDIDAASCQIRSGIADGIAPVGLSEQVMSVILREKLYRNSQRALTAEQT